MKNKQFNTDLIGINGLVNSKIHRKYFPISQYDRFFTSGHTSGLRYLRLNSLFNSENELFDSCMDVHDWLFESMAKAMFSGHFQVIPNSNEIAMME